MSKALREIKGNEGVTNKNRNRNESFPRLRHNVHPVPAHALSCVFMSCPRGVGEETAVGRKSDDNADSSLSPRT